MMATSHCRGNNNVKEVIDMIKVVMRDKYRIDEINLDPGLIQLMNCSTTGIKQ
jgi:hypothetical protein